MYSAYIDNFLNAKDAVRIAKEAKPAFHKFLEVSHRMSCFLWAAVLVCSFGKLETRLEICGNEWSDEEEFEHFVLGNAQAKNAALSLFVSVCQGLCLC